MNSEHQLLEVQDPDGNQYTIRLEQHCFTVGRSNDNDIVLPNPDKTISRLHCVLEQQANFWWVVDESSANGTFVQQSNSDTRIDVRQDGRLQLNNGDIILILGKLLEPDEPIFWRLTFRDSDETGRIAGFQPPVYLEYSLSKQKLFWVNGREREEVLLRSQERTLVHYMAERNQAKNNQPVVCEYTSVIANNSYPTELIRKLYVIIKEDGKTDQAAGEAYVNMLKSCEGKSILRNAGFVPAE